MKINSSNLPNFDLLVAGFPCQSFSIVGQRKGLIDERGQIIYRLLKVMKVKEVKYFIFNIWCSRDLRQEEDSFCRFSHLHLTGARFKL